MTARGGASGLDADRTRQLLAYLAAALTAGGAAAHEVEDDVRAVARTLGEPATQVHAQPGGVLVSLGRGTPATYESVEGPLRLDQSAVLGRVRAGLLQGELSPEDALLHLRALRARPHNRPVVGMYLGSFCVAIGLALILQPSWESVVFGALAGPVVAGLIRLTGRAVLPVALLPCAAAFVVSLGAFWAAQHGWVQSPLRTLLPPVAVLLPGALIVTGISELVNGAAVSGVARLGHGGIQLVMFSVGVVCAAALLGVGSDALTNTRVDDIGWWSPIVGLLAVTAGICLMEAVPRAIAPWILAVLALTMAAQLLVQGVFGRVWPGAFAGAAVASVAAWSIAAVRRDLPRLVLFLPSFWLLVPGSVGLVTVAQLGLEPALSGPTAALAVSVILAIALGLVVGTTTSRVFRATYLRVRGA
ncbi:threonine/serine exporter family protein [Calidifontibacter terrae]